MSVLDAIELNTQEIVDAANQAEHLGWAKYKSSGGKIMVIMTQEELDGLLEQTRRHYVMDESIKTERFCITWS